MITDEMLQARLAEAQRLAETAPQPSPENMTLLDAAILCYRVDKRLDEWRETLLLARSVGVLTQAEVKRFNMAQVGAYRLTMNVYATTLERAAALVPFVDGPDLARVIPAPAAPVPFLTTSELRMLPRGVGELGTVTVVALVIIAALLVLGLWLGTVYILSTKATEMIRYKDQVDADAQAAKARVAAIQQCIVAGGTVESCTRAAAAAVPTPPAPPPPRDALKDMETAGTYLVWAMIGVAGLSLLPVITGTFQSLRGLAPAPASPPAGGRRRPGGGVELDE